MPRKLLTRRCLWDHWGPRICTLCSGPWIFWNNVAGELEIDKINGQLRNQRLWQFQLNSFQHRLLRNLANWRQKQRTNQPKTRGVTYLITHAFFCSSGPPWSSLVLKLLHNRHGLKLSTLSEELWWAYMTTWEELWSSTKFQWKQI